MRLAYSALLCTALGAFGVPAAQSPGCVERTSIPQRSTAKTYFNYHQNSAATWFWRSALEDTWCTLNSYGCLLEQNTKVPPKIPLAFVCITNKGGAEKCFNTNSKDLNCTIPVDYCTAVKDMFGWA